MASTNKLATSQRVDSETFCATGGVGRNQSKHSDIAEFNVNRVGRQSTNDEPKLPKGYRLFVAQLRLCWSVQANTFQADLHSRS
jgi:hypothetical protein